MIREASPVLPAIEYVKSHYMEEFDIEMLASMCYLCEAQFLSLFKKAVGMSPTKYKNFLRMQRAKALLKEGRYRESEIAAMLGFKNINYFCRVIKNHTGITPSAYQKMQIKSNNLSKF